jgi:hypothetical protein
VTPLEFCRALADLVAQCEIPDPDLRAAVERTFCFEDVVGAGLGPTVASIVADLGLEPRELDLRLPLEAQSTEFDRAQIQRILGELGVSA